MKQVKIIIRPTKINEVMESLRKIDVGGLTLFDVQGEGRADPPLVGDTYTMKQITVVVSDKKVHEIFNSISGVACTGSKGDGKIFVSDVVDALDICTKKTGEDALGFKN